MIGELLWLPKYMTFKRKLMNINKNPRRIQRDSGGRKKNPVARLLSDNLYRQKIKPSIKIYNRKKKNYE